MKVDLIVIHPKDMYYPWWSLAVQENLKLFNKVIIVMTSVVRHVSYEDYTSYLKQEIPQAIILEPEFIQDKDWRDVATNEALKHSDGDWVLFLEQDFLFNKGFLEKLFDKAKDHDAIGILQDNRFHPCCFLVKRLVLDLTSKDFSAKPPEGDHFYKISQEIKDNFQWVSFFGAELFTGYVHISGLSHNFTLKENWHRKELFYTYLFYCRELPQPASWRKVADDKLKEMGVVLHDDIIKSFFYEKTIK